MSATDSSPPRRLRLFLRDHRVLDATARVPERQHLATYVSSRDRYINLLDVDWLGTRATIPHMALKVDKVLWVSSQDGALPLTHPQADVAARWVEVELDGGYLLKAELLLVPDQQLTDYLQTAPAFLPLRSAELRPRGKVLGEIAVNHDAVQMVREIREEPGGSTEPEAEPASIGSG